MFYGLLSQHCYCLVKGGVEERHVGSGMKVGSHFFWPELPLLPSPLTCGEIKRNIGCYRTWVGKAMQILWEYIKILSRVVT